MAAFSKPSSFVVFGSTLATIAAVFVVATPPAYAAVQVTDQASLQNALNTASSNETVQLTQDITDGTGLIVTAGDFITLDLHGHSLLETASSSAAGIQTTGATLTVIDSTTGGFLDATGGSGGGAGIGGSYSESAGTIDLQSGTIAGIGGGGGAGIGGGAEATDTNTDAINIEPMADATAQGGSGGGAGVGTGANSTEFTAVTIAGSLDVHAGSGGVGVGLGTGSSGLVSINNTGTIGGDASFGYPAGYSGTASGQWLTNNGTIAVSGGWFLPAGSSAVNQGAIDLNGGTLSGTGHLDNPGRILLGSGSVTASDITTNNFPITYDVGSSGMTKPSAQTAFAPSFQVANQSMPNPPQGYRWETSGGTVVTDVTDLPSALGANTTGQMTYTLIATPLPSQAIAFTSQPPANEAPGGPAYTPTATGGASTQPVVLTVDTASASVCSMSNHVVSFAGVGTCIIDANQAGDANYSAAPQAQQKITVNPIATTTTLRPSAGIVFGQSTTATASVSPAVAGSMQFSVDGKTIGTVPVDAGGSATSPSISGLNAGSHDVIATFTPKSSNYATSASTKQALVVSTAKTITSAPKVSSTTVSVTVAPVAPGAGSPSGTVTFTSNGTRIGTAPVIDGVATLTYSSHDAVTIAANYGGDANFTGSSNSTATTDPTITATVTSAAPRSHFGWYHTSVRVTFTCAAGSAALTTACPAPITMSTTGAAQHVTETVMDADGGIATVTVSGINIDRKAPAITIRGVRRGGVYLGAAPTITCRAATGPSGLTPQGCIVRIKRAGTRMTYTATATSAAGLTRTVRGHVTVHSVFVAGAMMKNGAYQMRMGHRYQLRAYATGRTAPVLVFAAPVGGRLGMGHALLSPIGHGLWQIKIALGRTPYSHWIMAVRIGSRSYTVNVVLS